MLLHLGRILSQVGKARESARIAARVIIFICVNYGSASIAACGVGRVIVADFALRFVTCFVGRAALLISQSGGALGPGACEIIDHRGRSRCDF